MNKRKIIQKSDPKSIYQWHEGAGEYRVTCPRCKEKLSAPTLKTIKSTYKTHSKTKKCEDKY